MKKSTNVTTLFFNYLYLEISQGFLKNTENVSTKEKNGEYVI